MIFNRCDGHIFHKWLQVNKDGVYSQKKTLILEETEFGVRTQEYDILAFQCARCGKTRYEHRDRSSGWELKKSSDKKGAGP